MGKPVPAKESIQKMVLRDHFQNQKSEEEFIRGVKAIENLTKNLKCTEALKKNQDYLELISALRRG